MSDCSTNPDADWCINIEYTRTTSGALGGGGVLPRLLSFVMRAMAIAQLTDLHISIPKSGAPPGEVPEECFPPSVSSRVRRMDPRRVSFATGVTVLGDEPDIQIHPPVCQDVVEAEEMDSVEEVLDEPAPVIQPPPGFQRFSWPREEWGTNGGVSLFDFSRELHGWLSGQYDTQSVDSPSLPISPVLRDNLDTSVAANVGSSREDSNAISDDVVAAPTVMRTLLFETDSGPKAMMVLSSPDAPGPFSESPADMVADIPDYLTGPVSQRSPGVVPRWRLAREGPFLAERSPSSIRCLGAGCAFCNTTYRPSDHAPPSDDFGIPLHHPRLLEWLKLPESASLLEMGPGRWLYLLF